jgi:hypothetical protein
MKTIVAVVTLFTLAGCVSVEPLSEDQKTFSVVKDVPGATKDQIHTGAKIWIAENFRSAKAVIEYDNKEDGTLIGNGSVKYPCSGVECVAKHDWYIPFTMKIEGKDGKMRMSFSNIRVAWPPSSSGPAGDNPVWSQGQMLDIKPALEAQATHLAGSITQGVTAKKDW